MTDNRGEVVAWMGDDLIAPFIPEKQHAFFRERGLATDEYPVPLVPQSLLLAAREECERLKQAIWDARAAMGFDNDGNPTPAALSHPSLAELCVRDAREFRRDYDQACAEADRAEAELAECRRDAVRYRWLRDGLEANDQDAYEIAEFGYRGGVDAAIDACVGGEG